MGTGGIGTLAAVRHVVDRWQPAESGTVADHRAALERHLLGNLDSARQVEAHRSAALPDVVVDGTVGILLVETVSEATTDRIQGRLDRFDGEYPLLFVVGLDVRDWSAWEQLRATYVESGATIGRTEFVFESQASLQVPNHDWGDWRGEGGLTGMLVPSRRTVAYYVLACVCLLGVDLVVRYGTGSRPILPTDPSIRVPFVLTSVALLYLAIKIRAGPAQR